MKVCLGRFRLLGITCIALSSALFAGCFKRKPKSHKSTLRLTISAEPPRLNPSKAGDTISWAIINMCHESLMRMNANGVPELGLAERYTVSKDGLKYTFHIRPEARWSNGDALTAYDFEYSWRKILDPHFIDGEYAYILYTIKNAEAIKAGTKHSDQLGIQVENDRVLTVELEKPIPYFLDLISFFTFSPIHQAIESNNSRWANDATEDYVCSGPFKLTGWRHQDELNLEKNEHYWDANRVKMQNIDIMINKDANTTLYQFEVGDIDLIGSLPFGELPAEAMPSLINSKSLRTREKAGSYWISVNMGRELLQNKNIRKALALAINRRAITENTVPGMFISTTHMLPPVMRRNRQPLFEDGNVALAREHFAKGLEETGLRREDLNKIVLTTNNLSTDTRIAQAIQQQWRDALNIEVSLQQFEAKAYDQNLIRKTFDMARSIWIADYFDPSNFLDIYRRKNYGNNFSNWENAEFISLMEQSNVELNREKRQELLERAEAIIVDELPIIPLFTHNDNLLINPKLKGVTQPVLGPIDFKLAYFEE